MSQAFEDLRKGYEDYKEDNQEEQLSDEDKRLLEAKEDTLSARALMRLAYLKAKQGAGSNDK